jgi:hypothetical protein
MSVGLVLVVLHWRSYLWGRRFLELMRLVGAKMHMTTAFHPQVDDRTEAANKVITMYLCCFPGDRPRQWLRLLPWAEYIYNTA